MKLCTICSERPQVSFLLCKRCGRAFDRANRDLPALADLISWVANRARRFERLKLRKK